MNALTTTCPYQLEVLDLYGARKETSAIKLHAFEIERPVRVNRGKYKSFISPAKVRDVGTREVDLALNHCIAAQTETTKKLTRLKGFLTLTEGWDGGEAWPVEQQAYKNAEEVIKSMDGGKLSQWSLFPSLNGSILLSARGNVNASVYIGSERFTYSALNKAGELIGEDKAFSLPALGKAIEEIYRFLKDEWQT